ncbi:hypothetical protein BCR41DRAFT_346638, partial [Lobosporangium transversale]
MVCLLFPPLYDRMKMTNGDKNGDFQLGWEVKDWSSVFVLGEVGQSGRGKREVMKCSFVSKRRSSKMCVLFKEKKSLSVLIFFLCRKSGRMNEIKETLSDFPIGLFHFFVKFEAKRRNVSINLIESFFFPSRSERESKRKFTSIHLQLSFVMSRIVCLLPKNVSLFC